MTVVNSSANVYVEVLDRSQVDLPLIQVATGALVTFSKQGPVDQVVEINKGPNHFKKIFGNADIAMCMALNGYGHYTALTALLKMGVLKVVRVHNRAKFGGLTVHQNASNLIDFKAWTSAKDVDPNDPNKFFMDSADADFGTPTKDLFYIFGVDPNMYNGDYRVVITNVNGALGTLDSNGVKVQKNPNTFQIQVYSASSVVNGYPMETFIVSRSKQVDGYGRQQYLESVINGKSRYIRVLDNPVNVLEVSPATLSESPLMYYPSTGIAVPRVLASLCDGDSGITVADLALLPTIYKGIDDFPLNVSATLPPATKKKSGWQLFMDREEVSFDLLLNAGTGYLVQKTMQAVADSRGDCFAIYDGPFDMQGNKYDPTGDPISFRNDDFDADTANGAVYCDWFNIYDPDTGQQITVPPSGHVAAIYCNTDITSATWFSPAGLKRAVLEQIDPNFISSCMIYRQADRDALSDNQINFTRYLPNIGTALWNDNTLQRQESALSYVNVVRLLKFCMKSITATLLYEVFDPNDAFLRSIIVSKLNGIFEPIKAGQGLYGYNVICLGPEEPNSNNTYTDISLGNVNVDCYISPVIPGKRLMVRLIVNKAGATLGPVTTA